MDLSLITYFLPLHDNFILKGLAELFSLLAEDSIIILVGAFLYWCVNPNAGKRMACTAMGGLMWTLGLKNFCKIPRPWDLGILSREQVVRGHTATGYSFPSGHTTIGANVYGYFAKGAGKWWIKTILWAVVGLIGLSRIFLGCHTSFDVVTALVLSIGWIWLSTYLYDRLLPKSDWFIFLYAVPMVFSAVSLTTGTDEDIIKMLSFGLSALIGFFLEQRLVHYQPAESKTTRALQYALGVIVVVVLNVWPKLLWLGNVLWLKCLNYALIALWLSFLYPVILNRYNHKKQAENETK